MLYLHVLYLSLCFQGWKEHVISTAMEWLLAFGITAYFGSFIMEFYHFSFFMPITFSIITSQYSHVNEERYSTKDNSLERPNRKPKPRSKRTRTISSGSTQYSRSPDFVNMEPILQEDSGSECEDKIYLPND